MSEKRRLELAISIWLRPPLMSGRVRQAKRHQADRAAVCDHPAHGTKCRPSEPRGQNHSSSSEGKSGEIIRFSYRILDPEKAELLNDKKVEPVLIDPQAGVKLVVPSLEKVGLLRQTGKPEAGKVYWMAFSNKGRPVKRGHHVIVEIGQFHAEGLVVD